MNKRTRQERRLDKNNILRKLVAKSKKVCLSFFDEEYVYSNKEAIEELGLDEELIEQLVDDYIIQIIKAVIQFEGFIYELQNKKDARAELDYTQFRELAHKNLGVARNLRIKNAETLLDDLMRLDNLEELFVRMETLRACAVLLNPEVAYDAIKLIEVKSTF